MTSSQDFLITLLDYSFTQAATGNYDGQELSKP